MGKSLCVLALMGMLLSACAGSKPIQYEPKRDTQAPKTIERVLQSQMPGYVIIPHRVSVGDDCLQIWTVEEKTSFLFGTKQTVEIPTTICYKNIGRMDLHHYKDYWCVDLFDRFGGWMYATYSYDEADAKGLVDALHTMKGISH